MIVLYGDFKESEIIADLMNIIEEQKQDEIKIKFEHVLSQDEKKAIQIILEGIAKFNDLEIDYDILDKRILSDKFTQLNIFVLRRKGG